MTPLEKTLRIALRGNTEKAIIGMFNGKKGIPNTEEIQQAVEE